MITLRTDAKFDDLERLIDKIARPGSGETRKIADGITKEFQSNFSRQSSGAGRWAALAPFTVRERQRLGFPGNAPILVRTGAYRRSFVERGGDHYESISQSSSGLTIEVGSNDPRGPELERGRANMPARSVTTLDSNQEENLFRLLDFITEQISNQFWR